MQAASIEIRRSKGHIVVLATGRTGKGQKYIKASKTLKATAIVDKEFKQEMAIAVEELLGSEA